MPPKGKGKKVPESGWMPGFGTKGMLYCQNITLFTVPIDYRYIL